MIFKALSRSVFLVAVATGLFACSSGDDGNTTDVTTSLAQTAEAKSDVIALDSSFELNSVVEDTTEENQGILKIAFESLNLSDIEDKIIIIPATADQLDDVMIRVIKARVLDEFDANGKQLVEVEYTVPAVDELFDEVDFQLPEDAIEKAEVTHYFFPESFDQEVETGVAARGVASSEGAQSDKAQLKWFPNVNWNLFNYKKMTGGKKGAELDIADITVLTYGKEDSLPKGTATISGDFKVTVNDIKNTFKKTKLSDLNESVELDFTTESNLELDFKGEFKFDLFEAGLSKKKYKCGVSKVSTGKILNAQMSLSGARWNDNVCLGGFRVALPIELSGRIKGNGDIAAATDIPIPVSFDVFITLNIDLSISANVSLSRTSKSRTVKGLSLENGNLDI